MVRMDGNCASLSFGATDKWVGGIKNLRMRLWARVGSVGRAFRTGSVEVVHSNEHDTIRTPLPHATAIPHWSMRY
jgi:hypothetical protein